MATSSQNLTVQKSRSFSTSVPPTPGLSGRFEMDPPPEPPKTPPNRALNPTTPPTPYHRTPPRRIFCDINTRDPLGPFYWENRNEPPDFEVAPLEGGDFREHPTLEECADQLGLKLPSGESVLSGRPDPSELGPGAKLPPSISKIDRLLNKGDEDLMSLSGRSLISKPKAEPGAFLKSAESRQKMPDQIDSKPSSQTPPKRSAELGLMLPPPLKVPRSQQKKQTPKPPSEKSNNSKKELRTMPQPLLKGAALLQEMADMEDPQQAEEGRAKVLMDRLPHVQAASRRLQGQLGVYYDETWPLPPLPYDRNAFILEINATKIRAALENCAKFAVRSDRESDKIEFLDVIMKYREKRVVIQAAQVPKIRLTSFEEEKKASEAEASNAITRMMDEGLQEELKELEDEGKSEVPSTPKSLFHSVGPTPVNSASEASQGSAIQATEDEELPTTSEENEESEESGSVDARPDSANRSDASGAAPEWVYRENATPNPHYDREGNSIYGTLTASNDEEYSNDDQEMRTPTQETDSASAASQRIPDALAPPSRALRALSVHDSEVGGAQSTRDDAMTVSNTQGMGKGRETSPSIGETMSDSPEANNMGKEKEASSNFEEIPLYASQDQQKGKGKQVIPQFLNDASTDDGQERYGKTMGLGREKLDVAASLRNHSLTFVQSKAKERNPPVPQPENMPNTLTEAICSYIPLEAKSILTLTLERVDPPVHSPTDQRCILLKHFEVGLDGVEGLCQGTARIPETPEVTAERERRVGKIGTFKQGDGGFYKVLKRAQQKEQQYGKGYWYFFGVKFKQTGKERKLRKGGKWFLFGAPIEAVYHLDIKRSQEDVTVMLGGGEGKAGIAIKPFKANFKRTHTLFSRGGMAPMDIWPGGQDWDDGVFGDIRTAMAHNGLRVGFLYADTQTFTPIPRDFPAAGKNQAEKKRKQSGPDMTEEEMKAMEKSMKPKKLSDEDIGTILAMSVLRDRAKQDAEARS